MPKLNEYELARQLRGFLPAHALLIAVTAYGSAEEVERSREAGFDAHLVKPVDPDEVFSLLRRGGGP